MSVCSLVILAALVIDISCGKEQTDRHKRH